MSDDVHDKLSELLSENIQSVLLNEDSDEFIKNFEENSTITWEEFVDKMADKESIKEDVVSDFSEEEIKKWKIEEEE